MAEGDLCWIGDEERRIALSFTDDLDLIRFGVDQARRGWLTPDDVINTLPLDPLLSALEKR